MKKIVSFFVAATFAVALTSCGSKPAETTETETTTPTEEVSTEMTGNSETVEMTGSSETTGEATGSTPTQP